MWPVSSRLQLHGRLTGLLSRESGYQCRSVALPRIGALLHHNVEHAALGDLVFRRRPQGQDLHFLHGVDVAARPAAAARRVVGHHAVEQVGVLAGRGAHYRPAGSARGIRRCHAGRPLHQLVDGVPIPRQGLERFRVEIGRDSHLARVDHRALAADGDRLGDGAQLQFHGALGRAADGDNQVLFLIRAEALHREGQ